MSKCKYEPWRNEPLPYPRYEGYCSEQCMTADYVHGLETELEGLREENAKLKKALSNKYDYSHVMLANMRKAEEAMDKVSSDIMCNYKGLRQYGEKEART